MSRRLRHVTLEGFPIFNVLPDFSLRQISEFPTFGLVASYIGAYTRHDPASPYTGGSLSATGSSLVRRYVRLVDTPLQIGDQATFGVAAHVSTTQDLSIEFKDANFADLGSTAVASLTPGLNRVFVTVAAIPANTVYLTANIGGTGSKSLFAFVGNLGASNPAFIEAPVLPAPNQPQNLFPDPFWRQLAARVLDVDGYPLIGRGAPTVSLATAPSQSPFTTKTIFLPNGAASLEHVVSVRRLGLKVGDVLHLTCGWVARQVITAECRFLTAAGATVGAYPVKSIDPRVGADWGYGEINFEVLVTEAIRNTGVTFVHRSFSGGPVGVNGAYLIGISIAKERHSLRDNAYPIDDATIRAKASVPAVAFGKRIALFGDSIFADTNRNGYFISTGVSDMLDSTVLNVGFGGTSMAGRSDPDYDKLSMSALADAIASGNWAAQITAVNNLALQGDDNTATLALLMSIDWNTIDAIGVMYGTNDYGAEPVSPVPIGADTDTTRATFKGAINNTIAKIVGNYPHIEVVFFTPIYRDSYRLVARMTGSISGSVFTVTTQHYGAVTPGQTLNSQTLSGRTVVTALGSGTGGVGTYTVSRAQTMSSTSVTMGDAQNGNTQANARGDTLVDFVDATIEMARLTAIPVVDLYRISGINTLTAAIDIEDGIHPNPAPGRGLDKLVALVSQGFAQTLSRHRPIS